MTDREYIHGTHVRDGLRVGHIEFEIETLLDFIHEYKIKKFIEIGVHEGGLANILLDVPGLNYLGIESNVGIVSTLVRNRTIILAGDCFSDAIKSKVSYFINSLSGASIVYCDNGNKPKELIAYAPLINPGDIIMAHDCYVPFWNVRGLEGFGKELDFPKPEVMPDDVKFLKENADFVEVLSAKSIETRIRGFMRM